MSNAPCIRCGYGFGESDSCRIHNEAEARIEAERDAALARVRELEEAAKRWDSFDAERRAWARIAELEGALLDHHLMTGTSTCTICQAVLEGKK